MTSPIRYYTNYVKSLHILHTKAHGLLSCHATAVHISLGDNFCKNDCLLYVSKQMSREPLTYRHGRQPITVTGFISYHQNWPQYPQRPCQVDLGGKSWCAWSPVTCKVPPTHLPNKCIKWTSQTTAVISVESSHAWDWDWIPVTRLLNERYQVTKRDNSWSRPGPHM
jgi:hypothetical protein